MHVPADTLTLARNRARTASVLAWLAAMLAGWAVFAIADCQETAAAPDPDPGPLIDERYTAGFCDGLREAREAPEAAGQS